MKKHYSRGINYDVEMFTLTVLDVVLAKDSTTRLLLMNL